MADLRWHLVWYALIWWTYILLHVFYAIHHVTQYIYVVQWLNRQVHARTFISVGARRRRAIGNTHVDSPCVMWYSRLGWFSTNLRTVPKLSKILTRELVQVIYPQLAYLIWAYIVFRHDSKMMLNWFSQGLRHPCLVSLRSSKYPSIDTRIRENHSRVSKS